MNNKLLVTLWAILFSFMLVEPVLAAGETEYILEKRITAVTPVFMPNHAGDPNWIKGFQFNGDIFLQGGNAKIGSFSGDVLLANPPLNLAESYDNAFLTAVNDITGYGSFTVTAYSVGLGNSAQNGDQVLAYSGSISNGTGALENSFGLSAGNGVTNVFAGQGLITEVVNIRNGL
jgi:hypothetical protein